MVSLLNLWLWIGLQEVHPARKSRLYQLRKWLWKSCRYSWYCWHEQSFSWWTHYRLPKNNLPSKKTHPYQDPHQTPKRCQIWGSQVILPIMTFIGKQPLRQNCRNFGKALHSQRRLPKELKELAWTISTDSKSWLLGKEETSKSDNSSPESHKKHHQRNKPQLPLRNHQERKERRSEFVLL